MVLSLSLCGLIGEKLGEKMKGSLQKNKYIHLFHSVSNVELCVCYYVMFNVPWFSPVKV